MEGDAHVHLCVNSLPRPPEDHKLHSSEAVAMVARAVAQAK